VKPLLVVALVCLVHAVPSVASAQHVTLVRPEPENPRLTEAFNRLRGELTLHGFEVRIVEPGSASENGGAWPSKELPPSASVTLRDSDAGASANIEVADPRQGNATLQVALDGALDDTPALLALRTLELLRAVLRGEHGDAASAPPPEEPPPARPVEPKEPASLAETTSYWLGGGVQLLASLPGPTLAVGPELGIGAQCGWYGVRLALSGPALGARLTSTAAEARLRWSHGITAATLRVARHGRAELRVLAAAGVVQLAVDGEAELPFIGRTDTAWMAAAGAGLEGGAELGANVELIAASSALLLLPKPYVVVGEEVLETGRPLVATTLGLRVSF
jgi:hypothetical protein